VRWVAVVSPHDACGALVSLLRDVVYDSYTRIGVIAALGDTAGPDGSPALRADFAAARSAFETCKPHRRAEYVDLMCACVWALGKRAGPYATDLYIEAADHVNRNVRDYGLCILAAVGDDRAWDDMLAALAGRLAKKISSTRRGGEALMIITYLARHCGRDADRRARLAGLLREQWNHVPEAETVAGWFPGVGPDGRPAAEIDFAAHVPRAPWERPPMARTHWEAQNAGRRPAAVTCITLSSSKRDATRAPEARQLLEIRTG
jgi:hypothetical protein